MILLCHAWGFKRSFLQDPKIYIPPPKSIHHFAFGYHESLADSFWLRAVQDLDVCGHEKLSGIRKVKTPPLERVENEESRRLVQDLIETNRMMLNRGDCEKGWVFRILEAVSRLAPQFRMVYALGAPFLSVVVEDKEGAKVLFLRGVEAFPKDWSLHYRAAYHFLFEMNELEEAARLLRVSADLGAPAWVRSLASRVYTQAGRLDLGIQTLKQYRSLLKKPEQRQKLSLRIEKLERDLELFLMKKASKTR